MGQWLQALKQAAKDEARKSLPAVIRGEEARPQQPQYYEPEQSQYARQRPYGVPASSDLSPEQLQMIIAHAKLQGAQEELERSRAHIDATHHASAERIHSLALAAINKEQKPLEIRYRGSAHDKKERRFAELKFAAAAVALLLLLIFIFWVKDHVADYQGAQSATAAQQSHRHYKRSEEWDDR
jgi:hypothetical protein